MRKILFITLCLMVGVHFGARAQVALSDTSIVQYLERPDNGGEVKVIQSDKLTQRISRTQRENVKFDGDKMYISGYRIQVYSSNDAHSAKANALSREKLIIKAFPELTTYTVFTSPFWRVRVGDFRTAGEAKPVLEEMQEKFPRIADDMRIVKDKIQVPSYTEFTE